MKELPGGGPPLSTFFCGGLCRGKGCFFPRAMRLTLRHLALLLLLHLVAQPAKVLATVAGESRLSTVAQCLPSPARNYAEDVIWTVLRLYASENVGDLVAFRAMVLLLSQLPSPSFTLQLHPGPPPPIPLFFFFSPFSVLACGQPAMTPCIFQSLRRRC